MRDEGIHPVSRRAHIALAVSALALALLCAGVVRALTTVDQWFFEVMEPTRSDPALTPSAPDYADPAAWAALPGTEDGADAAVEALPAGDQASAPADAFYVHPTTWMGNRWNGPVGDPLVVEATERGGTLIQASAFNACCAVYAPRYRQAHGRAYVRPDERGDQAVDLAYADVSAAFDAFLERTGERPFVVAAHSQGSVLAARLLRERIAGTALEDRLVAAYLPGAPIRAESVGGLPPCASPSQTRCVAAWNARGPAYVPNGMEFDAADPDTMRGRICVNPITWRADDEHAPAEASAGALFLDTEDPALKPAFADARCVDGALVVSTLGDLERDLASRVLLWMMGPENYHPVEYQLFYADIRANAALRVSEVTLSNAPGVQSVDTPRTGEAPWSTR